MQRLNPPQYSGCQSGKSPQQKVQYGPIFQSSPGVRSCFADGRCSSDANRCNTIHHDTADGVVDAHRTGRAVVDDSFVRILAFPAFGVIRQKSFSQIIDVVRMPHRRNRIRVRRDATLDRAFCGGGRGRAAEECRRRGAATGRERGCAVALWRGKRNAVPEWRRSVVGSAPHFFHEAISPLRKPASDIFNPSGAIENTVCLCCSRFFNRLSDTTARSRANVK